MKPIRIVFMMILLVLLMGTPLAAAAAPQPAAQIDFEALDAFISAQMRKHDLPGVSLAVVNGHEIIYLKGYGRTGQLPMTPQTPMFIGSQSKSFTALAIAQLVDAGLLNLNDPVQTYIPWFRVADEEASARITLNHLLHHTSGLSESGFSRILPDDTSLEEAVRSLAQARLTAPVGTTFQYFNMGYDVLSYIIEQVSGQTYAAYIQQHIFDPLEMANSSAAPAEVTDIAQGYSRVFGFALPRQQPVRNFEIGAGYIVSTAEDMARYAIAMNQVASRSQTHLLSEESARRFFLPGLGAYAMGWHVVNNGSRIFHGGANETFHTDVVLFPKKELGFVLLVNTGYYLDHVIAATQLTSGVEDIVLGQAAPRIDAGWSVRWVGWGIAALVAALLLMHTFNFLRLRGWRERVRSYPPLKRIWDVAISFLIPALILFVVFSQMKAYFGYRFNLWTNIVMVQYVLPDVFILMVVGTIPDLVQGFIKLFWLLPKKRPAIT